MIALQRLKTTPFAKYIFRYCPINEKMSMGAHKNITLTSLIRMLIPRQVPEHKKYFNSFFSNPDRVKYNPKVTKKGHTASKCLYDQKFILYEVRINKAA
jgi:hypothetical protein